MIHSGQYPDLVHRFNEGPPLRFAGISVDGYDQGSNTVFFYDVRLSNPPKIALAEQILIIGINLFCRVVL